MVVDLVEVEEFVGACFLHLTADEVDPGFVMIERNKQGFAQSYCRQKHRFPQEPALPPRTQAYGDWHHDDSPPRQPTTKPIRILAIGNSGSSAAWRMPHRERVTLR